MSAVQFFESLNLNNNELQLAALHPLPSAPTGAGTWVVYTNTNDGIIYQNQGTAAAPNWVPIGAVASVNGKTGVVVLTKTDLGLGNVDNTSDSTKKTNFTGAIADGNTGFTTGDQVFEALKLKLDLTGGTLTGAVAMSSNKITGLATGTADGDAVNVGQMNEAINAASANFRGSFASYAALMAVAWQDTDPDAANFVSNNDYAYIADDETHNDEAWRYIYVKTGSATGAWTAAYRINEAPLTEAQMAALNSGITQALVAQITTNQNAISGIKNGTSINSFAGVESALANKAGKITVTNGTISTSSTSATVNYTGTLLNAYAVMGSAKVIVDIAYGNGTVTFSTAQAPSAAVTCYVVAMAAS